MGHMERRGLAEKGKNIGLAIAIIEGLRGSLDHERGGEIALNLDRLYDYMGRRLFEANLNNNTEYLDEVRSLLNEIRGAWVAIKEQVE
jgi:flagellar protein FliS